MKEKKIKVTGGGAYKYADLIQEKLGLWQVFVYTFRIFIRNRVYALHNAQTGPSS